MSTSPLYDSTYTALHTRLPDALPSQLETLAVTMIGVAISGSAAQGAIARAMPVDADQESKKQRLRRLLDNERIDLVTHFQPIAKAALTGLVRQRVALLLDRVLLTNGQNALVVSAAFRRRSIPLAWKVLAHTGSSTVDDQQTVLRQALALLPATARGVSMGTANFAARSSIAGFGRRAGRRCWACGATRISVTPPRARGDRWPTGFHVRRWCI